MSYNKASEEKKWIRWKQAEEKQLRTLGVSEDIIYRLHTYNWEEFNKERQYRQRQVEWIQSMDFEFYQSFELPIQDVESLLNSIDDFYILSNEDTVTLQALLYKIMGYTSQEVAEKIGLTPNAIDLRISKIKRKLKR